LYCAINQIIVRRPENDRSNEPITTRSKLGDQSCWRRRLVYSSYMSTTSPRRIFQPEFPFV
jgi:hypothetical protein